LFVLFVKGKGRLFLLLLFSLIQGFAGLVQQGLDLSLNRFVYVDFFCDFLCFLEFLQGFLKKTCILGKSATLIQVGKK